jgi:hypothetical protein
MPTYICSLPNIPKAGRIPELITDDPAAIAVFKQRWDVPGRGVFRCVGVLKEGARRRALETVDRIDHVHVDIDPRTLATPKAEVLRKLQQLPLHLEIRDSGGGYHVIAPLKEPAAKGTPEFEQTNQIRARLTLVLCGDPAPNHAAALLREVGSHNTKYGEPRLVRVLQEAPPVDVIELEELLDTLGNTPLFMPLPKRNGHDQVEGMPRTAGEHKPVDVEQRLAAMTYEGPGDTAIHLTQLHVTASLLRAGQCVDDVVDEVLEATRLSVRRNLKATTWNWAAEEHDIKRMCFDFINKNPELAVLLPDKLQDAWLERLRGGRINPKVVYAAHHGWHVRSDQNDEQPEEKAKPKSDDNSGNKSETKRGVFVIRAFEPFDLATLPPRQWLYGRHYQRGTVSATIAPGGYGKTTSAWSKPSPWQLSATC